LLARPGGLSPAALQALGYRELSRHLAGEISLDEAVRLVKRNTRHFARRQIGAFGKIEGVELFAPRTGEGAAELAARIAPRLGKGPGLSRT
jgi:tRNA A37 N6-isopentenylltransferase MiaA